MKIKTAQEQEEAKTMLTLIKKISDEMNVLDKANPYYQAKYQTLYAVRENIVHSMVK